MIAKGFTEPTERVKRLKRAIVDATPYVAVSYTHLDVYKRQH